MAISILLVDNHHMLRQALHALLVKEQDFKVIGEAGDKETAIELISLKQPDVLILDLGVFNTIEIIHLIKNNFPKTGILVLSSDDSEGYILESLRAGARSYILKESTSEELIRAIHEVASGHRYLGSPISERAIAVFMERTGDSSDLYTSLTSREREVLNLVVQGHTNSEIAEKLFVSPRTVEVHRANMMRKLRLKNHTNLVQYALERKILPTTN